MSQIGAVGAAFSAVFPSRVSRFFKDENVAVGLPPASKFQAGTNNTDDGSAFENDFSLPWVVDPAISWLDYLCWIEEHLDAGMVLHKPLPQSNPAPDTIAAGYVDDPAFARIKASANVKSTFAPLGYQDVVQRMATSDYRFVLKGYGTRAGYPVPVPALKTARGVPAIPDRIQWQLGNVVVGNCSGVPIFQNAWELWYFIASPPIALQTAPANLAEHIRADQQLPQSIQVPYSPLDANALPTPGPQTRPSDLVPAK